MTFLPSRIDMQRLPFTSLGILLLLWVGLSAPSTLGEGNTATRRIQTVNDGNKPLVKVLSNSATWNVETVEYSFAPSLLTALGSNVNYCSIAVYLKNRTASAASVADISIDGDPGKKLISSGQIAWWRTWPATVKPGGVTQLLIKMSNIGQKRAEQIRHGSPGLPWRLSIETHGTSDRLEMEFALPAKAPPLRINFIAFDEKMQTLYVYVAADDNMHKQRIERVEVNGVDVTEQVYPPLDKHQLRADTLPLRIDLKAPLPKGAPVVVTVRAGACLTGHAVRAFPSRFPIQLTILGNYPEIADIEKIANLAFTDVGFCGSGKKLPMYLAEMKKRGLMYFPYTGNLKPESIDIFQGRPKYPAVSGWWLDEVDKPDRPTPYEFQQMLARGDSRLREMNIPPAPYCANICEPNHDKGYIELVDAVSHEYGIDYGVRKRLPQVNFKNPEDISTCELRVGRRPWWPYFRNIEAVLLVDPKSKEIVKSPFRPIDPREHRLIVYSCLANGAKGALNWNYGVNYLTPKQSKWLSDNYDAIRLNMTALRGNEAFGKVIPQELLDGLQKATDECGRVNVELRLLGPLLAIGDVSALATVRRSKPAINPRGGPAVYARAIVCGVDTIVLLVVNLNIDSDFKARDGSQVRSYEPVSVDVELTMPPWLPADNTDIFEVSYNGISPLDPKREQNNLHFHIPVLNVSKAIVITSDSSLRGRITDSLIPLHRKLANPADGSTRPSGSAKKLQAECHSPWALIGLIEELRADGYRIPSELEAIQQEVCFKLNVARYFREKAFKKRLEQALALIRTLDWIPGTSAVYRPTDKNKPSSKPRSPPSSIPVWETREYLKGRILSVGLKSYPYLADFDGDGKTDLLVGDHDGFIYIYLNKGSKSNPQYGAPSRLQSTSTGKDIAIYMNPKLNLVDMNGDGKKDLLLGSYGGAPYMLPNQSPTPGGLAFDDYKYSTFRLQDGKILDVGNYAYPHVVDWNADGLLDILAGEIEGRVLIYLNCGSRDKPVFRAPVQVASIAPDMYPDPFMIDLDGDSLQDLLLGSRSGRVYYFQNQGTDASPVFSGQAVFQKAGDREINVGRLSHIYCGDWNDDGAADLLLGNDNGEVRVLPGRKEADGGTKFTADILLKTTEDVELIVKVHPIVCFADWNGDGKLDILAGGEGPEIRFFPNVGTAHKPRFESYQLIPGVMMQASAFASASEEERQLWGNAGLEFVTEYLGNAAPEAVDWDNDGKLDLLVGNYAGLVYFYRNTGTKTNPVLAEPVALKSNRQLLRVAGFSTPRAVDWNGDGKPDLICGDLSGRISVFLNEGTEEAPMLSVGNTVRCKNETWYCGPRSIVEFGDLNNDGLNDLLVGNRFGRVYALVNRGTKQKPKFDDYEVLQDRSRIWEQLYGGWWAGPAGKDAALKWKMGKEISDMGLEATSCPRLVDFYNDGNLKLMVSHRFGRVFIYTPVRGENAR